MGKKSKNSSANSNHPPSSRDLSNPKCGRNNEEDEEVRLRSMLSNAAMKFPKLISDTAAIGKISDAECSSSVKFRDEAVVWLSEACMISSGLHPGDLVSVSLAATTDCKYTADVSLDKFSDGFARQFGFDSVLCKSNSMGNYFAIATLFSSCEVMKDSVRLSPCLSCTMGFPTAGRVVFVHHIQALSKPFNVNEQPRKSIDRNADRVSLCKCENLYLKLVPLDSSLTRQIEQQSPAVPGKLGHFNIPNGNSSSPKTPNQPKLPTTILSSPFSCTSKKLLTKVSTDFDSSIMKSALADEKMNKLLKTYVVHSLHGRCLLDGNFISLSRCSKLCLFLVECSKPSPGNSSQFSIHQEDLCDNQTAGSSESDAVIFTVDSKTKVDLFDSMLPTPRYVENEKLLLDKPTGKDIKTNTINTLPKLGGLSKEIEILKDLIKLSLTPIDFLPRYKGILLYGPPGTGKTSLACYCVQAVGAEFFSINAPELVSEYYGESEQALCEIFDSARQSAPSVVFIDELDAIAPARKDGGENLSLRMVGTLLNLMDGMNETSGVILLAATNRPDSIDPALRRPGRFCREIEIGVPSPCQRLDILTTILDQMCHSLSCNQIESLAYATHGFVGADLHALCNEAAMLTLRRYHTLTTSCRLTPHQHVINPPSHTNGSSILFKDDDESSKAPVESVSLSLSRMSLSSTSCFPGSEKTPYSNDIYDPMLKVTAEDFEKAKLKVRPSAMREIMLELPKVFWEDVGGQTEIKKQLIEAVLWPQMHSDALEQIGVSPPKGLLMFGPPGCSKTLMARAVASEAKLNFLAVKGPEIFSKWLGDSEKAVKSLFAKAKSNSPSIIFFDEIDGLAITRGHGDDGTSVGERVLSQLLIELDGLDQRSGVTVIAATNRPDKIDPALLRPGRFDRHLDVKPPDIFDREAIFHVHMKDMPCSDDATIKNLASLTEGYTGADIKLICREAALAALEEVIEKLETSEISMELYQEIIETLEISMAHFKVAIGRVRATDTEFYLKISHKFKRYVDASVSF